jgi:hypothetical protein
MEQKCKYQCTVENNRIIAATTAFTGTDDQNQNTIHHLTIAGRTRVQPIDFDYRTNLPHSRYNINTDQRHTLSNRTVALVVTFPLLQPSGDNLFVNGASLQPPHYNLLITATSLQLPR